MLLKITSLLCVLIVIVGLFISCTVTPETNKKLVWLTDAKKHSELSDSVDSSHTGGSDPSQETEDSGNCVIVLNTSSKTIHLFSDCTHISLMKDENKLVTSSSELDDYLGQGYEICKKCSKNSSES